MTSRLLFSGFMRNTNILQRISRFDRLSQRMFKPTREIEEEIKNDDPIKYSTSKAGQWKARYSLSGEYYDEVPNGQGLIVAFSLFAFMLYFFYLREENDLDDYIRYVEENVPLVLRESNLRQEIQQGKRLNTDVSVLEKRLEEVLQMKKELADKSLK